MVLSAEQIDEYYSEGRNALAMGDYEQAKNFFITVLAEPDSPHDCHFYLGKTYFFLDEHQLAIERLQQYLSETSKAEPQALLETYNFLGHCYDAQNDGKRARFYYKLATSLDPANIAALHNLGLLYTKWAEIYLSNNTTRSFHYFVKAYESLKAALDIGDTQPACLNSLGMWHIKYIAFLESNFAEAEGMKALIENHLQSAVGYYRHAADNCLDESPALQYIIADNLLDSVIKYGDHHYQCKEYEEAKDCYLCALALNPEHVPALKGIGLSFYKQELYDPARNYFLTILQKTTDKEQCADAWLHMAYAHQQQKSWEPAVKALYEANKLTPNNKIILMAKEQLFLERSFDALVSATQAMFSAAPQQENEPKPAAPSPFNNTVPLCS